MTRLRQGVLVANAVGPTAAELRARLGLGPPHAGAAVPEPGVESAVMSLGDTFIGVIAPVDTRSPAARRLRLHGPGGYMVLVQVDDVAAARRRARQMGVRIAWERDDERISAAHLHPRDTGGTLLSLHRPADPDSWPWAGPAWSEGRAEHGGGELLGVTIAAKRAAAVAVRWAALLDRDVGDGTSAEVRLDRGVIRFVEAGVGPERIVAFDVAVDPAVGGGRRSLTVGGVRFQLRDA